MALRTITPKHRDLRQFSIFVPHGLIHGLTIAGAGADVGQTTGEPVREEWSNLDRLLVRFWESHSIRPKVVCTREAEGGRDPMDCVGRLLVEIVEGGIIDRVESSASY
jgi:hypothetical protein